MAFLEAALRFPEHDAGRKPLEAAFLALRVIDQWMWLGISVAATDSQVLVAAQSAIKGASKEDSAGMAALNSVIEAVTLLQEPDAQPVLPRLYAYAGILEHRGQYALAGDVYATIVRYVDSRAHFDLAYDALMRQAFCLRNDSVHEWAQRAYESAGALAARARDRGRVLQARIGEAKVTFAKGNVGEAERALDDVVAELRALGDQRVLAIGLHDLATVIRQRGDVERALQLAQEAYTLTDSEVGKERLLLDIGVFLSLMGAYETSSVTLNLLERGAKLQESRWLARQNLMDLAARQGDEASFQRWLTSLESESMPPRLSASYLRDAGKGYATFGRSDEAREALDQAASIAERHGMHQVIHDIEQAQRDLAGLRADRLKARAAATAAPRETERFVAEIAKSASNA